MFYEENFIIKIIFCKIKVLLKVKSNDQVEHDNGNAGAGHCVEEIHKFIIHIRFILDERVHIAFYQVPDEACSADYNER